MSGLGPGLKDGKAPLATKKKKIDMDEWSPIGNALKIPLQLVKYAKSNGIEYRWLSKNKITKNSGTHDRGWKVFRVPDALDLGVETFHLGNQGPRELTRGSMVLGYKPTEAAEYHRDILREKATRMKGTGAKNKETLKDMAKETGGITITEGYEDNKEFAKIKTDYTEGLRDGK